MTRVTNISSHLTTRSPIGNQARVIFTGADHGCPAGATSCTSSATTGSVALTVIR